MESTSTFRSDTFHESIGYLGILLKGRKRQSERERKKGKKKKRRRRKEKQGGSVEK